MLAVSTIGFTKTSASAFFDRLIKSGATKLFDVRLNNTSQLSGFAKAKDLEFFCKKIAGISYTHQPLLAPTDDILKAYKIRKGDWSVYERQFMKLMESRSIENRFKPNIFDNACLLCSEATPHHCHRRLVCDYLNAKWGAALNVTHL